MDRPKGTIRLWDKEFNLLAAWGEDEEIPLCVTQDWDGMRVSGYVRKIEVVSDE